MQSFAFTKKAPKAVKVAVQHDEAKAAVEYLTAVNERGLEVTNERNKEATAKIIPTISNTFEVGTGRKRKVRADAQLKTRVGGKQSTEH